MKTILLGSPVEIDELKKELPSDFSLKDTGQKYFEFDDSGFSLFLFILGWAAGIPAGVIANAIYDAIRKSSNKEPTRISINKRIVRFDRKRIAEVIEEEIRIESPRD